MKKFLAAGSLLIIIALTHYVYDYPIQERTAKNVFQEYTELQGIDQDNISSKKILRTMDGCYIIDAKLKDTQSILQDTSMQDVLRLKMRVLTNI